MCLYWINTCVLDITLHLKIKDLWMKQPVVLRIELHRRKMEWWRWGSCRVIGEEWMCLSHVQRSNTVIMKAHLCRYTPLIWKPLSKLVLLARFAQLLPYRKCQGCKTEAPAKYEVHGCSVLIRIWKSHMNEVKTHLELWGEKKSSPVIFINPCQLYYNLEHLHL